MHVMNLTFKEAFDFVHARRARICPKNGFQQQLQKWEQALLQNRGQHQQHQLQ